MSKSFFQFVNVCRSDSSEMDVIAYLVFFEKNGPTLASFSFIFVFFKHTLQFYNKWMWKMSIQYTVLWFELATANFLMQSSFKQTGGAFAVNVQCRISNRKSRFCSTSGRNRWAPSSTVQVSFLSNISGFTVLYNALVQPMAIFLTNKVHF